MMLVSMAHEPFLVFLRPTEAGTACTRQSFSVGKAGDKPLLNAAKDAGTRSNQQGPTS